MEAIFLVCGAGGPQLKRNPLGCARTRMPSPQLDVEPSTIVVHQRDPDELHFFRSPARACGYLEPIEVEQNEYSATYDAAGNRLRLITKVVPRRYLFGLIRGKAEVVDLVSEPTSTSQQELRDLLRASLAQRGQQVLTDAPLQELLRAALAREGYIS